MSSNEKRIPVAEYTGDVVSDGEEGFWSDPDDAWAEGKVLTSTEGERFLYGTELMTFTVRLEDELENWLQEAHEDASDSVDMVKLKEAERLVNEALAPVKTYVPDYKVIVLMGEEPK